MAKTKRENIESIAYETLDKMGRETILNVHVSNKELPLRDDVSLTDIASTTTGFIGADLVNLVNEAALLGDRQNKVVVERVNFIQEVERSLAACFSSLSYSEEHECSTYLCSHQ
ncbi:hypothetical protein V2J09_011007 [Rumex salicifolius]